MAAAASNSKRARILAQPQASDRAPRRQEQQCADLAGVAGEAGGLRTAGLSTVNSAAGTIAFQAPEQFEEASAHEDDAADEKNNSSAVRVGIQADIYGFAGVMLHVLTGKSPFTGAQMLRIINDKLNKKQPPPELKLLQKSVAPQAQTQAQFLARCFAFAPTDRPNAGAVVDFCQSQLTIAEEAASKLKRAMTLEELAAQMQAFQQQVMGAASAINANVLELHPAPSPVAKS